MKKSGIIFCVSSFVLILWQFQVLFPGVGGSFRLEAQGGGPNKRALSKAKSGFYGCFSAIKTIPSSLELWIWSGGEPGREAIRAINSLNRALQMDPSIQTYEGEWKNGQTYREAFSICEEKLVNRLEFYLKNSPSPETRANLRPAIRMCKEMLAENGPLPERENNLSLLKKYREHKEYRDKSIAKYPRALKQPEKIYLRPRSLRRGETLKANESLIGDLFNRCVENQAKIIEYERPGRIVFSPRPIQSLSEAPQAPVFKGGEPIYMLVEVRHHRRFFNENSKNMIVSFKRAGAKKALVYLDYTAGQGKWKYNRIDEERGLFLGEVVPELTQETDKKLWRFAWELAALPADVYILQVAQGEVGTYANSRGEVKIDTRQTRTLLKNLGYTLWTRIAREGRIPVAVRRDARLEATFQEVEEARGNDLAAEIVRVILLDKDWHNTYSDEGLLVERNFEVATVIRRKDGLCAYGYGGIQERFIKRVSAGLRYGVSMSKKDGWILCETIGRSPAGVVIKNNAGQPDDSVKKAVEDRRRQTEKQDREKRAEAERIRREKERKSQAKREQARRAEVRREEARRKEVQRAKMERLRREREKRVVAELTRKKAVKNPGGRTRLTRPQLQARARGLVGDGANALVWRQCGAGQHYYNGECVGSPRSMNWQAARGHCDALAQKDPAYRWRLPNKVELKSLLKPENGKKAWINTRLFPATVKTEYWTMSPYKNYGNVAWVVNFESGIEFVYGKNERAYVRCVASE